MQKFDCTKHVSNQSQDGVTSYDVIQKSILFPAEGRLDQSRMQSVILSAQVDDDNNLDDFSSDAMLCLYDPMDVFRELSNYLKYLWVRMESLLISLKTGVPMDDVEKSLRKSIDPKTLQENDKLKQIEALHNIAVNIRAVGFANEKNIDKIGEEIDGERLAKILAVDKRKLLKDKIQQARLIFIKFLESDYYKLISNDIIENIPERIAYAKYEKAQLLLELGQMPNFKDTHIETPEESKSWNYKSDEGIAFLKELVKNNNTIGKVFDTPTILESIEGAGNYTKWIAISDSILEMVKSLFEDGDEMLIDIERILNRVRPKIKDQLIGSVYAISELGKEFRKMDNGLGRIKFVRKTLNINKKSLKEFKKTGKKYFKELDKILYSKQLTFSKAFENALQSDLGEEIDGLQSSGRWQRLLRNVSFINLGLATAGLRKSDNKYQKGLNAIKFLVAVGDAHVAMRNVKGLNLAKTSSIEVVEAFGKATTKRAAAVGYVGVLIDAGEAGLNFWERDYDAAVAYSGAVAASLVGILITTGVVNGWNPLGWAAIIAGLALGFYAAFLEDSPMERIAKNGVFGEIPTSWFQNVVSFNGDYLTQINQHIKLEVRNALHKDGFKDWADYPTQYRSLMDILVSGRVKINPVESSLYQFKDDKYIGTERGSVTYSYKGVGECTIDLTFGGYLNSVDQLNYEILYFKNGLGTNFEIIDSKNSVIKTELIKNSVGLFQAKIHISLAINFVHENGKIMVLSRIAINSGTYLPVPDDSGAARYVAAILSTVIKTSTFYFGERTYMNNNVVTGTKTKLTSTTQWR